MSKSVDETVFDFLNVLLREGAPPVNKTAAMQNAVQKHVRSHRSEHKQAIAFNWDKLVQKKQHLVHEYETDFRSDSPNFVASRSEKRLADREHLPSNSPQQLVDKQALEKLLSPLLHPPVPPAMPFLLKDETASCPFQSINDEPISAKTTLETCHSQALPATQVSLSPPNITKDLQEVLEDEFQVLFFKVAGLTLAVPLVSLGGILKVGPRSNIIGRPTWFLGVQVHKAAQLNIVDTCAWVMPEKYTDKLAKEVNYKYIVLLEESNWGLTCESLAKTVNIRKSEVNWRSQAGKRPWLAGIVKEQMCGILHVQSLVEMLNAGLGYQD